MSSSLDRQHADEPEDQLAQENINDLARIIASEARGLNETAQAMVGWTVVNRTKQRHLTRVSEVWANGNYAHSHMATAMGLRLAESILNGSAMDISQGATYFYSPTSMPKEGERPSFHADVSGGLESVSGVMKNGRPIRNFRPGWAVRYTYVRVPGIQEKEFKFYRP